MSEPKLARRAPRRLQVVATRQQSPLTRTIIAAGELDDFPQAAAGAHIKLFLPQPDEAEPELPTVDAHGKVAWPARRPVVRTYSVRHFDAARRELHIEFVLHEHGGPASRWAAAAAPGCCFGVAGPAGPLPVLPAADSYVFVGDLSARPAIASLLEHLPPTARGVVLCEVPTTEERRELVRPAGVETLWLVQGGASSQLARCSRQLALPFGSFYAWVAGEHHAVVEIRDNLRRRFGLTRSRLYAVPYWKRGSDEETYHAQRHRTMDELDDA